MKYYVNGRAVRESTSTDKEMEASSLLKEREGRVATGEPVLPKADRVRYEQGPTISGHTTRRLARAT